MAQKKPKVLIIDDEKAICNLFQQYLEIVGFDSKISFTLEDASRTVETEPFDAIILDLSLRDGSALQWLPKFKKLHPLTPVIVVTGMQDAEVEATQNGADYFFSKPLDLKKLRSVLYKCLELATPGSSARIGTSLSSKK